MKIIPKDHIVLVWDAAAELEQEIEESWKVHAICALKMHVPEIVQEDELNILTGKEKRAIEVQNNREHTAFLKENYKTITVCGIVSRWLPSNGPLHMWTHCYQPFHKSSQTNT